MSKQTTDVELAMDRARALDRSERDACTRAEMASAERISRVLTAPKGAQRPTLHR
jgi:hypothetical protein